MNDRKPAVLLIDPVNIGVGYKQAARDMGLAVVSLYTNEPGELNTTWPNHSAGDDVSLFNLEAPELLAALAGLDFEIRAVVPAMESAVHLTDVVAHELGLPGNDLALAWARRNKVAMREHAAAAGIRIPAFRLVKDPSEVLEAAESIGYPVIVKQTMGAGSLGTTLVNDSEAARNYRAVETVDMWGWPVEEWLVEEYVRGREFAVNAFSSDGEHRVLDMWEYRQPDDRDYDFPLWDNVQAVREDRDWARVEAYVEDVLTAFGVHRGPSHTEVKVNADGVYLMETAARLPGGPATDQWSNFTDIRPFHDALECYLGKRPPVMDRPINSRAVFGASAVRNDDAPGTLVAVHGLEQIRNHPGVDKVLVSYQPGDHVPLTTDTKTIPFGAWVSGPDQDAVVRVLAEIRDIVRLEIVPDRAV
ncbi:ATP-grasp domain-containing protein [Kitasatospora sp. NPDC051914]|uniref:ATP-grasp domain-containing protein n=1 Tax=Kitasatospora sp. NPDC051914 TaxID=3154945 RepID=UPI003412E064